MDNQHDNHVGDDSQNRLDQPPDLFRTVPIRSEQHAERSGTVPNHTETIPNEDVRSSEPVQNGSEHETIEVAEPFRTAPICSAEHPGDYTITVREAARIFDEAGVPRTERAITKWCNQNARGITRLACCYSEPERKYFITPASIEKTITEERHKFQYVEYQNGGFFSEAAEDLSEQVRNDKENRSEQRGHGAANVRNNAEPVPNKGGEGSEQRRNGSEQRAESVRNGTHADPGETGAPHTEAGNGDEEKQRLKDLQRENFELRVQLEGQKYLVKKYDELVDNERTRHEREKIALVDRLTDARHQIGSLEQRLLQIEATKAQVLDAEVGQDAEDEPYKNTAPTGDAVHYAPSGS